MAYPSRTDRAAIVAAAIEVLNDRGLEGVSLRAIADRLGIRQPALYHHFANKSELLDAVAGEVLDRHHTARFPEEGEAWDAFLARNARSMRGAMLAVRDGARLIASTGGRAPSMDVTITQVEALERGGFATEDAILAFIAVSRYTVGSAIEQQTARDGGEIVMDPGSLDDRARRVIAGAGRVMALGQDHEFEAGLSALIRGLRPA